MNIRTERDGLEFVNNHDGTWTLCLVENDGAGTTVLGHLYSRECVEHLSKYLSGLPKPAANDNAKADVQVVIWRDSHGPLMTIFDSGHERKSIAFTTIEDARRTATLVVRSENATIEDRTAGGGA